VIPHKSWELRQNPGFLELHQDNPPGKTTVYSGKALSLKSTFHFFKEGTSQFNRMPLLSILRESDLRIQVLSEISQVFHTLAVSYSVGKSRKISDLTLPEMMKYRILTQKTVEPQIPAIVKNQSRTKKLRAAAIPSTLSC